MEASYNNSAGAHSFSDACVFPWTYTANRVSIHVCHRHVDLEVPAKVPTSHEHQTLLCRKGDPGWAWRGIWHIPHLKEPRHSTLEVRSVKKCGWEDPECCWRFSYSRREDPSSCELAWSSCHCHVHGILLRGCYCVVCHTLPAAYSSDWILLDEAPHASKQGAACSG